VRDLQEELRDGAFVQRLMEFGLDLAQMDLEPPTAASGDDALAGFLRSLWNAPLTEQGAPLTLDSATFKAANGLSELFGGVDTVEEGLHRIRFADNLIEAAKQAPSLAEQADDLEFLDALLGLGGAYAALNSQSNTASSMSQESTLLFLETLWRESSIDSIQRGANEFNKFVKNSNQPNKLLNLSHILLNVMRISSIEGIDSTPESIGKLFEIVKLIDSENFNELLALPTNYVSLVAGLSEFQEADSQYQSTNYEDRLREIVSQLSQGSPDVSNYINPALDPDDILVASNGDVAITPAQSAKNLQLRQEPKYNAVVVDRDLEITFFDYAATDGDIIDVYVNGKIWQQSVSLVSDSILRRPPGSSPLTVRLPKILMQPGENVLEIKSRSQGISLTTVGVDFEANKTIYGNWRYTAAIPVGDSFKITFGLPKIRVNGDAYPYSADHIIDVFKKPRILTIDRGGNDNDMRRDANLERYRELGGVVRIEGKEYDQDESPPAVFAESVNAHVRLIPRRDNQDSGNQLGTALNFYGSKKIRLRDGWNVDFYATESTVPTPLLVPDVPIDWEYKIL
jgi:hypothetical protein